MTGDDDDETADLMREIIGDDADEIADLMREFDNPNKEKMSEAEIAAVKADHEKLVRDLANDLDMISASLAALKAANLDTSEAETAREILINLRKVQDIVGKTLALGERLRRPN